MLTLFVAGLPLIPAQSRTEGRVLLDGVVRSAMPVAVYSPDGSSWEGEWGTSRVQVTGNAAVFLWPGASVPRLQGPGAPPADAFQSMPPGEALVGFLPVAANRTSEEPLRGSVKRALELALGRPVRRILLDSQLEALPRPVWLALDLVVAGARAELDRFPAALEWIRLGGQALVLEPLEARNVGLGRIQGWEPGAGTNAPSVRNAFAAIRPPRPILSADSPSGSSRVWPALMVLAYLAGLAWSLGTRHRVPVSWRWCGLAGALLVGAGTFLAFPGGYWNVQRERSVWCFPGPGQDAWVHSARQVWTRGRGDAVVSMAKQGHLFTHLPSGSMVRAKPGRTEVIWSGSGWVSSIGAQQLGQGLHVRQTGSRTFLSMRLPPGVSMTPAFWIEHGNVRELPVLQGGQVHCLEDVSISADRDIPEDLRSLLSTLEIPASSGILVGELRSRDLRGRHVAYAIP